jgi:hypothetical protein
MRLVISVVLLLLVPTAAFCEESFDLGPRQYEKDTVGMPVLCIWRYFYRVDANIKLCDASRTPSDNAIHEAVVAMEDFIIANSSLKPTRDALEAFKRKEIEQMRGSDLGFHDANYAREYYKEKACKNDFTNRFRTQPPEKIKEHMRKLLAQPREPVMGECL